MTNSILSSHSEKEAMEHNAGGFGKGYSNRLNLIDLVDNIDDMSEQAINMPITKKQFLGTLREVTRDKVLAIKQAKTLFDRRIKKMILAQSYEL